MISEQQYITALAICRQYRNQISNQIAEVEGMTIKDFIDLNPMSPRLRNVLYRAVDKGHTYIDDLNERNLMRIQGCGSTSLQEFQLLINKPKQ